MIAHPILVVEDNDDDFYIIKRLISSLGNFKLDRCAGGNEVSAYLLERLQPGEAPALPLPCIILLDLNMPGKTGHQVLSELKADERMRSIPVIIMSTSNSPQDVRYCYENYASGYVVKPVDLDALTELVRSILAYWCGAVTLPVEFRTVPQKVVKTSKADTFC